MKSPKLGTFRRRRARRRRTTNWRFGSSRRWSTRGASSRRRPTTIPFCRRRWCPSSRARTTPTTSAKCSPVSAGTGDRPSPPSDSGTGLFYRVFIGSTGISLVPVGLIRFYWVLPSLLVSIGSYNVFNGLITRLYLVELGFIGFSWVILPGFICFSGISLVPVGLIRFYWVFT